MTATDRCDYCDVHLDVVRESRATNINGRTVTVDDEWMRCPSCDEEFYTRDQADQLHKRAIKQIRLEDGLLAPDAIKAVRIGLGLTQRELEQLIGTGEKTCVRWESGKVCQSVAADRLIRVLGSHPETIATVAAVSGVIVKPQIQLPRVRVQPRDDALQWLDISGVANDSSAIRVLVTGTQETPGLTDTGEFAAYQAIDIPRHARPVSRKDRLGC